MTAQEAKRILLACRPGGIDDGDPEVAQALAVARADPEVQRWFEEHCAFQATLRSRLRSAPVPAHLKEALLARQKVVSLPLLAQVETRGRHWWQSVPSMAAAAAVVLTVLGLWASGFLSRRPSPAYAEYQGRMVATVLREYRMDVETPDLHEVRRYMESRGAPGDFELTPGLQRLEVAGGGFLRWRNNPVSMVCFRRPDKEMVYLFVLERERVKDPPPSQPQIAQTHDLQTAAWTSGDKTYLLTAPADPDFRQKYL